MADTTPSRDSAPRPIGAELIIPIAAIAFTVYYFWTILGTPWTAQVSAFFVGTILLLLSVAFVAKRAFEVRRGRATLGLGDLVTHADVTSGRAAIFVLTLLYIYVIQWGGFTITTFFYLFISIAILNRARRLGRAALVSFVVVIIGYLLFIVAFNTRFPHGPFEILMQKVFFHG
jgi:Tripartite tricarboxylate transporter TctB family